MELGQNFIFDNLLKCLITILIAVNVKRTVCSRVVDGMEPNVVRVSDYCPKMPFCEEGSHVICIYYNPSSDAGPYCSGFMKQTITQDLASKILDIMNAIRSKIALGKETGKHGQYFPKGYGLMRLKWDSELATFAQVMANQCSKKGDLCRSSNRFPDPEQNVGVIRFARPNWVITAKEGDTMIKKINSPALKEKGLNKDKIRYAIYKILESWYDLKNKMESWLVNKYPNFTVDQTHLDIKRMANMISGSATHVGCGISAFSTYTHHNITTNSYNSIVLICNISGRPKPGQSIYETEPPTRVGYTIRCGCPPGYEEDEGCLCYESSSSDNKTSCVGKSKNCKPAVVLLPIVTAEDAPPPQFSYGRHSDKTFHLLDHETKKNDDIFGTIDQQRNYIDNEIIKESKHGKYEDVLTKPKAMDVKNRYFNKNYEKVLPNHDLDRIYYEKGHLEEGMHSKSLQMGYDNLKPDLQHQEALRQENVRLNHEKYNNNYKGDDLGFSRRNSPQSGNERDTFYSDTNRLQDRLPMRRKSPPYNKASIFSRMPKFELPQQYSQKRPLKSDVAPRKDFESTKVLLDNYLKRRKGSDIVKISVLSSSTNDAQTTPTHTKNLNKYLTNKFNYEEMKDFEKKYGHTKSNEKENFTEEPDQKFMNLLDKLEQEVKHIALNMKEKEIVDAKIRKIYGHIVGKPPDNLAPKNIDEILAEPNTDNKDDFTKYEIAVDNHLAMEDLQRVKHLLPHTRPTKNLSFKDQLKTFMKSPRDELSELINNRRSFKASNYKAGLSIDFKNMNDEEPPILNFRRKSLIEDNMKSYTRDAFSHENNADNRYENMYNNRRQSSDQFERERKTKDFKKISDDALDTDRRKYYQEKLDMIQKKFQSARGFNNRNEHKRERELRLAWSGLRSQDIDNNIMGPVELIPNRPEKQRTNYYDHDRPRRLQDL